MAQLGHFFANPSQAEADEYAKSLVDGNEVSLEELKQRKEELESKLSSSTASIKETLDLSRQELSKNYATLISLSQSHLELQGLIEHILSLSNNPPSLLQDLDKQLANLRDLLNVRDYVSVVHKALVLANQAIEDVKAAVEAPVTSSFTLAFNGYYELEVFVRTVSDTVEAAVSENGELGLVKFVTSAQNKAWNGMRKILSDKLIDAAKGFEWPKKVDYDAVDADIRLPFEIAFLNLLRLQEQRRGLSSFTERLYPLASLVVPISQRFTYHFIMEDRPMNKLDKPEWFFSFLLNAIQDHRKFIETVVLHIVSKSSFRGRNVLDEWISLLLPLARDKLSRTVAECISTDPPLLGLLAHAVNQSLIFDDQVSREGYQGEKGWGVAYEVLDRKEWFDTWVNGESGFAQEQFDSIISAPDAWSLQRAGETTDISHTTSSIRFTSLLTSTLTPYRRLPLTHQLPFLICSTIPLCDAYHERIKGSLDAYDALSGMFGRTIPGTIQTGQTSGVSGGGGQLTQGVIGIEKLVKAWISAKHTHTFLNGWEDELFFIELWDYIVQTDSTHPVLPNTSNGEGIFQNIIGEYGALLRRAEEMIIKQIAGEVEISLKDYFSGQFDFFSVSQHPESSEEITPSLMSGLRLFITHLAALPSQLRLILYRSLAKHITTTFMAKAPLLQRHKRTSIQAGKTYALDIAFWISTVKSEFGRGSVWRKLASVGKLIGLEEEEFADVEREVWQSADDEGWREKAGVDDITRVEAKDILRCRVETQY